MYELPNIGKVHVGLMKAIGFHNPLGKCPPRQYLMNNTIGTLLAYYYLRDLLKGLLLTRKDSKFVVIGHSLGGALAAMFMAALIIRKEEQLLKWLEGVYTFGQPRVGNKEFGDCMDNKLKIYGVPYFRVVYCYDLCPKGAI